MDRYSYHEALDRVFIQAIQLEAALGEHPVIHHHPEAKALYEQASDKLGALYQLLGELSFQQDQKN